MAADISRAYPAKAEARGEEALLVLKVLVGIDGNVEKCIRIDTTKADNFDDTGCRVFQSRAKFAPATDAAGKPVRAFYSISLAYRLN